MNFCSNCGSSVKNIVPEGDSRLRNVCQSCNTIHYVNPNNVCGAILTWENKILLCKRAIEPRQGLWTLPAGFMENGETVKEGAARESFEEANASSKDLSLFGVFSLPHISQVYIMFRGELESDDFFPGVESLETELYRPEDIPWENLAFPVVKECLRLFIDQPDNYKVHSSTGIKFKDGSFEWTET